MNVRHTLICVFFLSLCGGDSVSAKLNIYAGAEGGNGTINCRLSPSGRTKFFCKDECEAKDILIKTDGVRAQSGRYSTTYRNNSSGRESLSVTITHLIKSDSGRYRCGLGKNLVPNSYWDFEVRVLDASLLEDHSRFIQADTEGENITFGCTDTAIKQKFLCKGDCTKEEDIIIETEENRAQNGRHSIEYRKGSVFGLHVTITEVTTSDTGRYRCGYGRALSPDSYYDKNILVYTSTTTSKPNWTHRPFTTPVPSASTLTSTQSDQQLTETTPSSGVLLYVIVILVIAVIIMGLALMIICIQRNNRPDGLRTRGNSDGTNMEVYDHENCPAVHNHEDSTYQSLNPATMDEDQIYSALTHT
ncbi:polymeric immunoglobulin receptor-like isoform X4 [Larimichthys crocea]|uniref:polymeric immunoglobulin receptor-like isoform X4 n=1 Tax=Larimichthys crocea TaxID=215358 RepID=UPI000F6004A4|nr:polymeric immunoglobulin receptor-like isoform X4 [Larimichthys crocea]